MRYTLIQTPKGVRDIMPPQATHKAALERRASDFLRDWGYERVTTPTFEYDDALSNGYPTGADDDRYRFVDRDGSILALRSDMTTPIARVVANRLKPGGGLALPLRFHYVGSVFRYDEPQAGRHREFTQIGAELIGFSGPVADAEMITTAIGLLKQLGLSSFRVDLGHAAFFPGVMEGKNGRFVRILRDALLRRDFVQYERIVKEGGLAPDHARALARLPVLRGFADVPGVIVQARQLVADFPAACQALDELQNVYNLVDAYGFGDHVGIDLGMVKNLDYYSGVLMEGYVPELGFTLCTGGRYDHLIGRFTDGADVPAVGFAFGSERALLALERQGKNGLGESEARVAVPLVCAPGDEALLFQGAAALRQASIPVRLVGVVADGQPALPVDADPHEETLSPVTVVGDDNAEGFVLESVVAPSSTGEAPRVLRQSLAQFLADREGTV